MSKQEGGPVTSARIITLYNEAETFDVQYMTQKKINFRHCNKLRNVPQQPSDKENNWQGSNNEAAD